MNKIDQEGVILGLCMKVWQKMHCELCSTTSIHIHKKIRLRQGGVMSVGIGRLWVKCSGAASGILDRSSFSHWTIQPLPFKLSGISCLSLHVITILLKVP